MTDEALLRVLERARDLGFLGPGPVTDHVAHAKAYVAALPRVGKGGVVMDIGTGAGVPGLALASWRRDLRWHLVDAMAKRIAFVRAAVEELDLQAEVIEARAEELAADPDRRASIDVVVARSLAAPAVAAEYAAPFLKTAGTAAIAEPPGGAAERWPTAGLARLGMRRGHVLYGPTATVQILEQFEPCPGEFPRRVGAAAKRPLF
ncbi:MAG TPA: RsmG family class I SAM-dependent methyltransferase [Acidimicrobiales bacterium]|nr:RsmG family class I SAM-dependent methyltransferase [Acidimicrobiales bacterium]